jgi:type IV secretion system protein VirB9
MKTLLFCALALCLSVVPAFAATPDVPAGWPPSVGDIKSPVLSEIDYLSPKAVPLNEQEKKALQLSSDWSRRNIDPVLSDGGKILFVHGASLPTIVAAPMQVSDVELQSGETVHEIVVGDSARWMVDSGTAGSGPGASVHLFIKPVDAGLESSAVVTTDRRVYHLRLVSQRSGHTPYVGFMYSDDLRRNSAEQKAREARDREWASTSLDGKTVDLSALNKGKQDVLVNYRVKDSAMIVDGLFERIALVIGVGGDQEKIEIIRGAK